ncbi:hypothetical protein OQA88_11571 [Cercophora sp. LCS_1]
MPPSNLETPNRSKPSAIPLRTRRSMLDELRPLPPGWVREFDPDSSHQFFIDTNSPGPRAIWKHPFDDEEYCSSHPSDETSMPAVSDEELEGLLEDHIALRKCMKLAMDTGKHQFLRRDEDGGSMWLEPPGHMFPGVSGVRELGTYLCEVFYEGQGPTEDGERQREMGVKEGTVGPKGRYVRPRGEIYGYGYGGYGCGKFGGGRWGRPDGECRR